MSHTDARASNRRDSGDEAGFRDSRRCVMMNRIDSSITCLGAAPMGMTTTISRHGIIMTKLISAFLLVAVCCVAVPARARDDSKAAVVKHKAREVGAALQNKDYARVIDLTYPRSIELMGGREKALRATEAQMRKSEDAGYSIASVTIGDPGEFLSEGTNTFVVVPSTTEMKAPGGRIVARSYLLGISPDAGKTWTFIDGSGLRTAERRKLILPRLPAKLELPEFRKPEFIKEK